jgi:hypothetical protein
MASTPFGKIAKRLSGRNSQRKRRWHNIINLSSASSSSFKKGCGNFIPLRRD